jgi:hypothetical protein
MARANCRVAYLKLPVVASYRFTVLSHEHVAYNRSNLLNVQFVTAPSCPLDKKKQLHH